MKGYESNLEQTIDQVFGAEPYNAVDEQLFKWLIYALIGNGRYVRTLDALNFTLFKEKLSVLLDAVYQWHLDQEEIRKNGV
ncbi:hypothetical protein BDD43_3048 [Mucilaginibacter gracilis]|uniref:Uncharacterized protein n=1 Tax=Mucilaginibacter gracilis TaxID=423350 RepID=A0A495J1Q0_9SPHI|nr:hypothetical protein [Mucilaginibacter gracilis]RKR82857.1 hypothetical protein BDD43_3048 [Mucilaginibacter gracilis]